MSSYWPSFGRLIELAFRSGGIEFSSARRYHTWVNFEPICRTSYGNAFFIWRGSDSLI